MDRRGQDCPDFFFAGYFSGLLTRVRICAHRRSKFMNSDLVTSDTLMRQPASPDRARIVF